MASLPLNTFRTITAVLTTNTTATVYTAPIGVTSIVLMTQIANLDLVNAHAVTFAHQRNFPIFADASGHNAQPAGVTTIMLDAFLVPPNDAANAVNGKMIVEQLDSVVCYADSPGTCNITLSVLETANA